MDLVPKLVGLGIVFGLLALWAWAMRRAGHGRWVPPFARTAPDQANLLHAAASLTLTPQHRLHLVVYEQRQIIVLTAPGGGAMLDLENRSSFFPAFNAALARQGQAAEGNSELSNSGPGDSGPSDSAEVRR